MPGISHGLLQSTLQCFAIDRSFSNLAKVSARAETHFQIGILNVWGLKQCILALLLWISVNHRITELKRAGFRWTTSPAGISVRSLCSSRGGGRILDGPLAWDYSLPSVGSSWACWLWPSSSWQHFKSSNESSPVIFPSLFFNLVIPSFFLFFHLWLGFNHLPFYFWGWSWILQGVWKKYQRLSMFITGHLCWANPHPVLWETLPGTDIETFKHNS